MLEFTCCVLVSCRKGREERFTGAFDPKRRPRSFCRMREAMDEAPNRRRAPRHEVRIPLRVRLLSQDEIPVQEVESLNVSRLGVCFETNIPLQAGADIEIFIKLPKEIAGRDLPEWCCLSRVVHVDLSQSLFFRFRVGVGLVGYVSMGDTQNSVVNSMPLP